MNDGPTAASKQLSRHLGVLEICCVGQQCMGGCCLCELILVILEQLLLFHHYTGCNNAEMKLRG